MKKKIYEQKQLIQAHQMIYKKIKIKSFSMLNKLNSFFEKYLQNLHFLKKKNIVSIFKKKLYGQKQLIQAHQMM